MERVDRILQHALYREHLDRITAAEAKRRFCRHNMGHFLDVARIARIIALEEEISVETELLYCAALLHDVGRDVQYLDGTPHELAGAQIAPVIMQECGYSPREIAAVTEAIASHRDSRAASERNLKGLLYRADKASRACFACEAEGECDWKKEKKNLQIRY